METLSRGGVLVGRASKARAKALRMPHRSPLRRQLGRRWSMDCGRSKFLSKVLVPVARQPFVRYRMLASLSPQLLTLHLFRTMAADRPSGGVYNALCV